MRKNIIFVVHNWIGDVGYAEDMSKIAGDYLPFRGLSAWFSSSVRPTVVRKWGESCRASPNFQADGPDI